MAKFDFESILESVKQIMLDNFNNKLASITAEKGDGLVLPEVVPNAYFLQSLDESIVNFSPFIAYGIVDIETTSLGHTSAEKIIISALIILDDNGRDNINKVMFRYSRAFKEIFEENWQIVASSTRINVTRTTAVPFESNDSSITYKATGIELEITLS